MKFEEFVQNDENLAKFENCQTQKDVDALLAAEGVEIDPATCSGELDEDELENVAGGLLLKNPTNLSWGRILWIILHLGDILRKNPGIKPPFSSGGKAIAEWVTKNKNKLRL